MYDIIGDIHGYCSKLVELLLKLEYAEVNGTWKHPERKIIFVPITRPMEMADIKKTFSDQNTSAQRDPGPILFSSGGMELFFVLVPGAAVDI